MSAATFQAILDKALDNYREQIGVELDKHPFTDELRGRGSPHDILKLLEDKAKAFKAYREGNRKLINWLSPVVQVIHTLSGILGQAVSVPFPPAQAIFAGVDILLTAADGVSSSYDALVDLFECVGNFLKRLRIYTDVPMSPLMTDILVKIMVELLSVFALATKQIKQGRFKKFAKKLLGESEIEAVLQRLDRLTQEEGRMTVAQTLEVVHGLVNNVKIVMNDGKVSMDGILKALDAMQQMASEINKIRRDQMQIASKNWLSPPDPSKNYNIGYKAHQDGTAAWFFEGNVFDEWNAKGSLLWIHGKPGAGKSILLSSIVRKIESKRKAGLASMAYFYFDFRDAEKQHLRGLLSSLIFQLSANSDPCYQILSRLYSGHAGGAVEPPEDVLSECLVEMLKVPEQPPMYIIVDALDECPNISGMPTPREQVLEFIEHLVKLDLPNVHICATSRLEIDIRNILEPLALFRMSLHDESGQKEDISSYINKVVHADQRMRRWRNADKQLVIDSLSDKADGMFRWVFCQLEILRRTLPAHIRRTLKEMPKTLDETYEHALLAIDGEMRQYAQHLFQCLAVSIRPLRVEELADILAVRFDEGDLPKFNPDWRLGEDAQEAVLSVCSNLISVVNVNGSQIVQFSHFSVKEFLTSDRLSTAIEDLSGYHIVPRSAHTILAQASLSVLLQLNDNIDADSITDFPLSCYAAQHWVEHGQFEGVSPAIQVATEHLFDPDKPHFANWLWIYDMDDPWREDMHTTQPERPPPAAPIYYAVLCGFHQLIEQLISACPGDVNARGGYYESPLSAAFAKEHIDIALLLLRRGADVNVLDKSGRSPLHRALEGGRIDIVQLLLDHGADVNLQNDEGTCPLVLASSEGELEISRLLLQRGADVNSQNYRSPNGHSSLHGAAQNGHLDVARHLLECGANIESRDDDDQTPLYLASYGDHVQVAELLVQHGADVDSPRYGGRTSLHAASIEGHVKIAELLIQHGADVGSRDDGGLTPLHQASCCGRTAVAELLIQRGADVGSRDKDGRYPLHLASQEGHIKIAELLIQHGADAGSRTDEGQRPVYVASRSRHVNTAEPLVREDADLGSPHNEGLTPLHAASFGGHVKMAEWLIQHGADVGSRDNDGSTPLQHASYWGQTAVAELLIQRGADLGSRDNDSRTPLHKAALRGHLEAVKLLVECGADRNIRNDENKTPLDLASDNDQPDVANFLSRPAMALEEEVDTTTSSIGPQNQHPDVAQLPQSHRRNEESNDDEELSMCTASEYGQIDVVRSLLDHGSDIEEKDSERRTPLALASRYGQLEVAKLLIERGANVNSREPDGWTPLHLASRQGHLHIVRLLLDHNADIDACQRNQRTALDLVAYNGHLDVAELLIERGANANVRNSFGRTPKQVALAGGNRRIAELLSER